jgi:hypothetical protein
VSGLATAALLATGLRLAASHAYPDGAPAGFSGGFKEDSCQACHFSQELNAAPGRVSIEGVPARYDGGKKYVLTITLTREEMKRAGFQLASRFTDGGGQAGSLAPGAADGERVDIAREGPVQYANQKKAGSSPTEAGVARWTVEWTAPATGGAVVFNVAANAADGDGTTSGDYIYTSAVESAPAAAMVAAGRGRSGNASEHRLNDAIAPRPQERETLRRGRADTIEQVPPQRGARS